MDRDDLRDFSSESDGGYSSEGEYTAAVNAAQWRPIVDPAYKPIEDVPSFGAMKEMYTAMQHASAPKTPRLVGGLCYYLGVLEGPEGSVLSPGHTKRHNDYLKWRIHAAKNDFCLLFKNHNIDLPLLLRVYISCMYFGDTHAARPEVSTWHGADETVGNDDPRGDREYTPYQHFVHHHNEYIKGVTNQVCPGQFYRIEQSEGSEGKEEAILPQDVQYALTSVLWKLLPAVERSSYL